MVANGQRRWRTRQAGRKHLVRLLSSYALQDAAPPTRRTLQRNPIALVDVFVGTYPASVVPRHPVASLSLAATFSLWVYITSSCGLSEAVEKRIVMHLVATLCWPGTVVEV